MGGGTAATLDGRYVQTALTEGWPLQVFGTYVGPCPTGYRRFHVFHPSSFILHPYLLFLHTSSLFPSSLHVRIGMHRIPGEPEGIDDLEVGLWIAGGDVDCRRMTTIGEAHVRLVNVRLP